MPLKEPEKDKALQQEKRERSRHVQNNQNGAEVENHGCCQWSCSGPEQSRCGITKCLVCLITKKKKKQSSTDRTNGSQMGAGASSVPAHQDDAYRELTEDEHIDVVRDQPRAAAPGSPHALLEPPHAPAPKKGQGNKGAHVYVCFEGAAFIRALPVYLLLMSVQDQVSAVAVESRTSKKRTEPLATKMNYLGR